MHTAYAMRARIRCLFVCFFVFGHPAFDLNWALNWTTIDIRFIQINTIDEISIFLIGIIDKAADSHFSQFGWLRLLQQYTLAHAHYKYNMCVRVLEMFFWIRHHIKVLNLIFQLTFHSIWIEDVWIRMGRKKNWLPQRKYWVFTIKLRPHRYTRVEYCYGYYYLP